MNLRHILLSTIAGAFVFAGSSAYACDCQKADDAQKVSDTKTDKDSQKTCACKRKTKDQAADKTSEATPCGCSKKDA